MTETAEQKLTRYEYVIDAQMTEIDRLRAENERLRAEGGAHAALKDVYLNPESSEGNKIKAAAASLPFERPKLMSVEPPLELRAVEPLKDLLERRRARADRLKGLGDTEPPIEVLSIADGRYRNGNGGNDS
jgi:hypothetical protein